ncbi:uncharacterized protein BDR25DRAFT_350900 [Lindgomyces ingoldianus]|uniref:Uncharacterized protein n=1 Tax=Lindgomyces ingoldianus TaxID=673940 RepID=A0ACB6R8F4_9PLEO|nr:uncharacterized protein BDR25DRAFT_350900 [Lindgomyces ingoldianus]KAF2475558.1 hypothetical protein BDR25DRAFT_350900 [Lindgomyces ingoldianus]
MAPNLTHHVTAIPSSFTVPPFHENSTKPLLSSLRNGSCSHRKVFAMVMRTLTIYSVVWVCFGTAVSRNNCKGLTKIIEITHFAAKSLIEVLSDRYLHTSQPVLQRLKQVGSILAGIAAYRNADRWSLDWAVSNAVPRVWFCLGKETATSNFVTIETPTSLMDIRVMRTNPFLFIESPCKYESRSYPRAKGTARPRLRSRISLRPTANTEHQEKLSSPRKAWSNAIGIVTTISRCGAGGRSIWRRDNWLSGTITTGLSGILYGFFGAWLRDLEVTSKQLRGCNTILPGIPDLLSPKFRGYNSRILKGSACFRVHRSMFPLSYTSFGVPSDFASAWYHSWNPKTVVLPPSQSGHASLVVPDLFLYSLAMPPRHWITLHRGHALIWQLRSFTTSFSHNGYGQAAPVRRTSSLNANSGNQLDRDWTRTGWRLQYPLLRRETPVNSKRTDEIDIVGGVGRKVGVKGQRSEKRYIRGLSHLESDVIPHKSIMDPAFICVTATVHVTKDAAPSRHVVMRCMYRRQQPSTPEKETKVTPYQLRSHRGCLRAALFIVLERPVTRLLHSP